MNSDESPAGEPYEHSLLAVVSKLRNEPFLFVIAIVILLMGLVTLLAGLGSSDLRFIVLVIAVLTLALALTVIIGYYMVEVRAKVHAQAERLGNTEDRLDWTEEAIRKIVAYTPGYFAHQTLCQIRDKADEYYIDTNWHKKRILLLLLDNGYLQPPPGANEVVFSDEQEKRNKRLFEIAALTPMAELMLRLREEISRAPTGG